MTTQPEPVDPGPSAEPQTLPAPYRTGWRTPRQHLLTQESPVILSVVIMLASLASYYALYWRRLERYPDVFDFTNLVNAALPLVIVALGQTVVVVVAGLDLSVGGVFAMAMAIAATKMLTAGDILPWSVVILGVGLVAGLVNGLLVAYARLAPILVTIATLSIFNGLAILILPQPGGTIPQELTDLLTNTTAPLGAVYIALALLAWFALRRSKLGVALWAVGNDEAAAIANGINARRAKATAYVISGLCAAMAGIFFAARTTGGDASKGGYIILASIAAVFLGGANGLGGRASFIGTAAGAIVLTLINNILFFARVNSLYQPTAEGAILIAAVLVGIGVGKLTRGRHG